MGGLFSKPSSPKLPKVEETETPQTVTEDEYEVKKRARQRVQTAGRAQNILSGIESVLKKRLGE